MISHFYAIAPMYHALKFKFFLNKHHGISNIVVLGLFYNMAVQRDSLYGLEHPILPRLLRVSIISALFTVIYRNDTRNQHYKTSVKMLPFLRIYYYT